ncbi:hypothetical protein VTL71DRAFT_2500 [Oculimacula yallundae]|uniref:Uncharacterized protein n=1 Tax=Oculimacula yallundae TaxID=86028 RepID=A0ABR4C913_9HELO
MADSTRGIIMSEYFRLLQQSGHIHTQDRFLVRILNKGFKGEALRIIISLFFGHEGGNIGARSTRFLESEWRGYVWQSQMSVVLVAGVGKGERGVGRSVQLESGSSRLYIEWRGVYIGSLLSSLV